MSVVRGTLTKILDSCTAKTAKRESSFPWRQRRAGPTLAYHDDDVGEAGSVGRLASHGVAAFVFNRAGILAKGSSMVFKLTLVGMEVGAKREGSSVDDT